MAVLASIWPRWPAKCLRQFAWLHTSLSILSCAAVPRRAMCTVHPDAFHLAYLCFLPSLPSPLPSEHSPHSPRVQQLLYPSFTCTPTEPLPTPIPSCAQRHPHTECASHCLTLPPLRTCGHDTDCVHGLSARTATAPAWQRPLTILFPSWLALFILCPPIQHRHCGQCCTQIFFNLNNATCLACSHLHGPKHCAPFT